MATKEIIEVGSSDEEAEPPPKKKKPERKPVPNAMVHIPSRLPGISIKPAKKTASNSSQNIPTKIVNKNNTQKVYTIPKMVGGGSKSNVFINPLVNKLKSNSITVKKAPVPNTVVYFKDPLVPKQQPITKTSHAVIKIPNQNRNNLPSVQIKSVQSQGQKHAGASVLSNLPSSITIKKASPTKSIINLPAKTPVTQKRKKNKPKLPVTEIPVVNLDDEEVAEQQSTSNPQWYMRPEESLKSYQNIEDDDSANVNFEEQNNREPETPKYVEITIEDSPIKPPERGFNEIGKELPVIIEDSPYKNKSNDEINHGKIREDPHSRKKLNYPQESQGIRQVVEIEIDPIATSNILTENNEDKSEDHPKEQNEHKTDEKCETTSQSLKVQEQEFIPTYQKFIDTCFEIENSDDMKKIVEKKIKAYYKQCPKEYVESEEFIDMVASKTASIKAGPDKMYLFIKDVVDELNMQRKLAKAQEAKKEDVPKIAEESLIKKGEEGEYGTKRARQIRKLEKTIKQLHRAIQKLEEQEVDLDDEENSMYLLTERYKERLVRVHAKFRQMTNTKMPSEPRIVIEARPGCPQGPAKKLEKFVNKKVPIGAPLPFPDFHDVLRCVRDANEEDGLGWSNLEMEAEARDLFERCGKKLKRRRQENEWRISVASRIQTDNQEKDPAEDNAELKRKLCENKLIAAKRESEVFNKYADRQHQLKLEPEEIGDKEAEESEAGESEEEEASDSHLADKEKRKEILKKLIQDKNKKVLSKNVDAPLDDAESKSQKSNPAEQSDVNAASANENSSESEIQKVSLVDSENLNSNDVIDIDSDEDELHLLQRLRFEDERVTSSSDSDSTIAISDSSESDSDGETDKIVCSDIISIENSSYSESEALPEEVDGLSNVAIEVNSNANQDSIADLPEDTTLVDESNGDKSNNCESMENIFLESSEEDTITEKHVALGEIQTCANSNDDVLSLPETVLEGDNDLNNDVDNMDKDVDNTVNESEVGASNNKEEIQPTNGDCIEPKDASEQATSNDNVAAPEININRGKEVNIDNIVGEVQEKA
ncbi:titin-like [Aricia agestis]|uniref:titin-like n=1 Tax=Aricia agestis TaxID=91739 RepID=UPI001C205DB2|nr:titin-like [Aricia agestis]